MPRHVDQAEFCKHFLDLMFTQHTRRELVRPALSLQFVLKTHGDNPFCSTYTIHTHAGRPRGNDSVRLDRFQPLGIVPLEHELAARA